MAEYVTSCYDVNELLHDKNNVTDLHAYYMSQFNLELENSNRPREKDSFKHDTEESFDFNFVCFDDVKSDTTNNSNGLALIDEVIDKTVDEQNIKEVLLDLDSIGFKGINTESKNGKVESDHYESNEYIDDESLIDELCREEADSFCITPDYDDNYSATASLNEQMLLPSIDTVFSKCYGNYNSFDNSTVECNDQETVPITSNISLEQYSYPNKVIFNINNDQSYNMPDTPTSCSEFTYERNERTTSISESIESDIQSYHDETFDEDDLFISLDDYDVNFNRDEIAEAFDLQDISNNTEKKNDVHQKQGERVCLWEDCYERYPNQTSLVEHIERMHVNSYKGDEFSCLWRECGRQRRPFNARYKLLIHMRVHSGHKPNRCHHPGCGKAFSRLENLKIHVRSHTGERPYACPAPHCRKAFSNSSDRAKHQRTHFNARPYACGAVGCGKRYTDPSSLRKHVKSHPHMTSVPRTLIPSRPIRRSEQTVPSSPAKLTTLRCIRDKLTVPRMQKF